MKIPAWALIILTMLLGAGEVAKADSINFTFSGATSLGYAYAYGTLSGNLTYLTDPSDLNVFLVDSGNITVVSNIPATPRSVATFPAVPPLAGYSDTNWSQGGFLLGGAGTAMTLQTDSFGSPCAICFGMAGNAVSDSGFALELNISGADGSYYGSLTGSDDGNGPYLYSVDGTFTLSGQIGDYLLGDVYDPDPPTVTPEPSSWLLLGSGVALLGFLLYRKRRPVSFNLHRI